MQSLKLGEHYIPGSIVDVLKPHQLEGIRFIYRGLKQHKGVILNDESGVGKTHQVVGYLSAIVELNDKCIIISDNVERLHHWKYHIELLTDLKVFLIQEGNIEEQVAGHYQILLAKSECIQLQACEFLTKKIKLLVIDETKNVAMDFTVLARITSMHSTLKLFVYSSNLLNNPLQLCFRLKVCRFPFEGILKNLLEEVIGADRKMSKLKKFKLFMATRTVLFRRYASDYKI